MGGTDFRIEQVAEADVGDFLALVKALADYEQLAGQVVATEEGVRAALFTEPRAAEAVFAVADGRRVGYAIWFGTFSTFLGRRGIYLEDIFVLPDWRGRGIGRALFEYVAATAVARGCGRMEWSVLDWNEPAMAFYRRMGALPLEGWTIFRLTGEALRAAGAGDQEPGPVRRDS